MVRGLTAAAGQVLKMPPRTLPGRRASRGVVLFVSLALLLALTIGSLSTAQITTLELRMARNGHDAAVAFHAAEAALLEAEGWLDGGVGDPAETFPAAGGGGLYPGADYGEAEPWRAAIWTDADASAAATGLAGVATPPRYVIEWLGSVVDSGTPAAPLPPVTIDLFRVTARGVGDGGAVVAVQSTYGRVRGGGPPRTMTGRLSWVDLGV